LLEDDMPQRRGTRSQVREFARLVAQLEPDVRRGFMLSVIDLQSNVDWPELIKALQEQNVQRAIDALHIDEAAFNQYTRGVTGAYETAGAATIKSIKQYGIARKGARFSVTNRRAEQWLRANAVSRVVDFTKDQIDAARRMIVNGFNA